jgi:hypothetical protein
MIRNNLSRPSSAAARSKNSCCLSLVTLVLVGTWTATSLAATMRFDNGGGTGLWETPANWDEVTNPNTLPGAADTADIGNSFTVNVSTAQSINELIVAHPNSTPTYTPGTATLNIAANSNIQIASTNGVRIGRVVQASQMVGSSAGIVNQTGGLLQINNGTNGLRLSQGDAGNTVADSVYNISGGSVRGGPTNDSMTAPLQVGVNTNNYNLAEFHMIGSGVTEARFEDVRIFASTTGVGAGTTRLHFSLDAGGVTSLIAEDEMRFNGTGNNQLLVDLVGPAPLADVTLISADRLTTANGALSETFTGLPDGSPISASFGPYTYNWNLRYMDGSDNGVRDAFVKLEFVSRTAVPEPASIVLFVVSGLVLLGARRGR